MPALRTLEALLHGSITEHALGDEFMALIARHELAHSGLLLFDVRHRQVSCNGRFIEIWGLSGESVEDWTYGGLFEYVLESVTDPSILRQSMGRFPEDSLANHQLELRLNDGRLLESTLSPILSDSGEVVGNIWRVFDITQRASHRANATQS